MSMMEPDDSPAEDFLAPELSLEVPEADALEQATPFGDMNDDPDR